MAITAGFTNGAGRIWLDNVNCRGTESRLVDCPASELGVHNCGHHEDAGVRCGTTLTTVTTPPQTTTCSRGAIRLLDGLAANSGRLEICINNVWGTVCDDLWGSMDAQVACRQLGLPSSSTYVCHSVGYYNALG